MRRYKCGEKKAPHLLTLERNIDMTKRNTAVKTISSLSVKCKNKTFVDKQIASFTKNTKSAIKNILKMSKTVQTLHSKYADKEIGNADVDYFCMSVNLKRNSSQYRKFICIGKHADRLQKYMSELPQSISVLYEITTLSADTFEELIESNQIKPNLTLSALKQLASKPVSRRTNKNESGDSMTLNFDFDSISESSKRIIFQFYAKLKSCKDIAITLPNDAALSDYLKTLNEDDEIIDASFRTIQEQAFV